MTKSPTRPGNGGASHSAAGVALILDDPIGFLELAHRRQAGLCDALETIADALPDKVDRALCASVAGQLAVQIPRHHRDEEDGLFPLLEARARAGDNLKAHLSVLRLEHATDEAYAEELKDVLVALAKGEPPGNPDMIGYMLRGFFENYRRHLNWENLVLLPLARARLTAGDLAALARSLHGRPHDASAGRLQ